MKEQEKTDEKLEKKSYSGRYRTKPVTPQEKRQYFRDYYLIYVVVAVIGVAIVGFFLYTTVFARTETVVSVTVLTAESIDTAVMKEELTKELKITDDKQEVSIMWMAPGAYQTNMTMMAWVTSGDLDVMLTDKDPFVEYSSSNLYWDLKEMLPDEEYDKIKDYLVEGAVSITDNQGNITGYEESKAYGVAVSYDSTTGKISLGGDLILSVMKATAHQEKSLEVFEYFVS